MRELNITIRAAGIVAMTALGACTEPPWAANKPVSAIVPQLYPPWTLNQSPAGISLRWYPDTTPSAAAGQVAQLHCASWNRSAELVSDRQDGSAEIAEYRCR
jgi:hypothetical protein